MLLVLNGRIAGITGVVAGVLNPKRGDVGWRALFVAGLVLGGALFAVIRPEALAPIPGQSLTVAIVAGVLVGVGTRVGNGCTSGHGVCGISRLSLRSIVATVVFMAAAAATVFVVRHVLGGAS